MPRPWHRPAASLRLLVPPAVALGWAVLTVSPARAQPVSGFYVGAGAGISLLQTEHAQVGPVGDSGVAPTAAKISFNGGVVGIGSLGYSLGNGLRVELEGGYRENGQRHAGSGNGRETKLGAMANVLFDIDSGFGWMFPYVGLGGGYQEVGWDNVALGRGRGLPATMLARQTLGQLAYQAIIGASFPVGAVPGLSLTAEYRYLGLGGSRTYRDSTVVASAPAEQGRTHTSDDGNHEVLLGLRYAFGAVDPSATPERPPLAVPVEGVAAARTYLIFFDWDRAELTPRARDLVAEAVRNSGRVRHTRIEVSGYADRTGGAAYNRALSRRRAQNVAAEMQRTGVPAEVIDVHAYGDRRPAVPTKTGVREPQNRRVEIVYR